MGIVILLLAFAVICFVIAFFAKRNQNKLQSEGFDRKQMIINVKYACGHPDLNSPGFYNIGTKDKNVFLLNFRANIVAQINGAEIKNIIVEDETTFTKKVTLTRMALVGIFAFALKKKEKNELAYLTIQWNDGRFDHETVFEYEGNGSLQKANSDRNKLIKAVR